jgi:FtsP/CotA-like multicopper oxidase with cupredoxin domain
MSRPLTFALVLLLVPVGITEAGVCPDTNVIQDPPAFQWTSQGGYWSGTLEIGPADLLIGSDTLTTRAYRQEGGTFSIPGPTISMTPGETYVLTFKNLLPYEEPSPIHNEFKDPNITNIHTHGLHVSGETPADDIKRLINGGQCGDYVYEVPWYHMGGTLWYHAHHHGSTYLQVSSGAFGMLIIDDAQDRIPANVAAMAERQLAIGFLDPSVAGTGGDTLVSGTLASTWTVNGLVGGNLCGPANEWQHWRVLLADRDARMKTLAVGPECEMALLARDGVWRTVAPLVLGTNSLDLTGASRADLAVRCSADSALTVNGTTVANIFADSNLPADTAVGPFGGGATGGTWSAERPDYLRDLRDETNVENRTVNMGARTINGSKWDPDVPTFTIPTGAVQELTVKGATQHPYHQHVYHVQMNGACGSFEDGEYYDTIAGSCDVRFDLSGTSVYDGLTVMHCHILSHEDQGAMGWMDVVGGIAPPSFPDPGQQQILYDCCEPTEPSEISCSDYLDNDCDGLTDGGDPDCVGGGGDCSAITNKDDCNADPTCEWQGSPKNGTCVDVSTCTVTEDPEATCDDGLDNDCDGLFDCDDSDCTGDPACPTGVCDNDGICDPSEDCESCPSDCDGVTSGRPANRYCCGNGVLEGPEGDGRCDGNP